MTLERSARADFVSRVAAALERSSVDHVFLHGYESARPESDVDIAVAPGDRALVDVLARTGAFGRLVQRVQYDVPWCVAYVVAADGSGRRYRQLDVACDPWGINRLGPAVRLALADGRDTGPLRTSGPAAETLFLAVKRACEGLKRPEDTPALADAFARAPDGAQEELTRVFGGSGRALAVALRERRTDLRPELDALRRSVLRARLAPRHLPLLAYHVSARAVRRVVDPRGLAVALVGPDGTGKSSLAAELAAASPTAFRRAVRLHVGPGLLPPPGRLLGRRPADGSEPHGRASSGTAGSLARLVYLWLDTALGWLPRVALPKIRVSLVLIERSWLDLAVDPRRYRLSLPARLIRAFARLLAKPDLTLLLEAPVEEIRRRKTELEPEEIERQLADWRRLSGPAFATVDASQPLAAVTNEAMARIEELTAKGVGLDACALPLQCLGGPARTGEPYVLLGGRWLLPVGAGGPRAAGLYRPPRTRHALAATALEGARRLGLGRRVALRTDRGLGPVLAEALGMPVDLAASTARDGARAWLTVHSGRRLVAYAKVTRDGQDLRRERNVLATLSALPLERIVVPEVIDLLEWNECAVLVLSPVPNGGRGDRDLGPVELAGLAELARLGDALGTGSIPAHGDFAPWNCAVAGDRLAVWDWEETRRGLPLEDFFHWQAQRLALFGVGSPESLVAGAVSPDPAVCGALGASPADAVPALRAALENSLGRGGVRATELRRRALSLLEEPGS